MASSFAAGTGVEGDDDDDGDVLVAISFFLEEDEA